MRGVDTPELRDCRRIDIAVEVSQQPSNREELVVPSVERLVLRGPNMSIIPEQELAQRKVALEEHEQLQIIWYVRERCGQASRSCETSCECPSASATP